MRDVQKKSAANISIHALREEGDAACSVSTLAL